MHIRIEINKREVLDLAILYLMLFQVFFFRWIGISSSVNYIIVFLVIISLLFKHDLIHSELIILLFLVFAYPILDFIIVGGSFSNAIRNDYKIIRGLLMLVYVCVMLEKEKKIIFKFLKNIVWPVNLYMLINIPVLLMQIGGRYDLAAFYDFSLAGQLKVDMISGLLGLYGTPCLSLFVTFLCLYDYLYYKKISGKRNKFLLIYALIIFIFNSVISVAYNDSKTFFVIFVLFALCIYSGNSIYKTGTVSESKKGNYLTIIFRILGILFLVLILALVFYRYSSAFKEMMDLMIRKINEGINYTSVEGGGERIGMILFLIANPSKWLFGFGMGRYQNVSYTLGFAHFGQADIGTYLCLGGFIYIILLYITIYRALKRTLSIGFLSALLWMTLLFLGFYTHLFTDSSSAILSAFLIACCSWSISNIDA